MKEDQDGQAARLPILIFFHMERVCRQAFVPCAFVSEPGLCNVSYVGRYTGMLRRDARDCPLRILEHLRYHKGCLYVSSGEMRV